MKIVTLHSQIISKFDTPKFKKLVRSFQSSKYSIASLIVGTIWLHYYFINLIKDECVIRKSHCERVNVDCLTFLM